MGTEMITEKRRLGCLQRGTLGRLRTLSVVGGWVRHRVEIGPHPLLTHSCNNFSCFAKLRK